MTWFRMPAKLPGEPFIGALAEALNISTAQALGHFVSVCCSAVEQRGDGRVADLAAATLEMWGGWRGRRGRFAAAFLATCVTPKGRIIRWRLIRFGPSRRPIPPQVRQLVLQRDGYACRICGSDAGLQIDHIDPWCFEGGDEPDNLQTLCGRCNRKKGPMPWATTRATAEQGRA